MSFTMAEYIALSDCACDCAWYKILFSELRKPMPYVPIYGDSHGAIFNAQNPITQKGIKHIEIHYHYIWEQIEKGEVKVFAVPMTRECHGFTNLCGLVLWVTAGAGMGCEFVILTQPVPTTQVWQVFWHSPVSVIESHGDTIWCGFLPPPPSPI